MSSSIRSIATVVSHRPPGSNLPARLFVWSGWGLMTVAATVFVAWYGTDVPVWDDENLTPQVVGAEPITLDWLWKQCNEHRLALPKLILVGSDRWSGPDIRAGMFLSVAALATLAAGLVACLGRLRGGSRAVDIVVPVLLLHPGHSTNLLWSIQFAFILATTLASSCLIAIISSPDHPGIRRIGWVAFVLACLPLCGGNGLLYVPALACWIFGAALGEARSRNPGCRRRALATALTTVPGVALSILYFRGFQPGVHPPAPGGLVDVLRTALQWLAGGIGTPALATWPVSGLATAGLLVGALLILARTWLWHPAERTRAFGLLCFLGGVISLALAVGWGRGWSGSLAGFQDRYITLATPFWCWLLVVGRVYASKESGRKLAIILLGCCGWVVFTNSESGIRHGNEGIKHATALTRDISAGMFPYQIIRKYASYLHPSSDRLAQLLTIMRAGKLGPFARLRPNPPLREISLPIIPAGLTAVRWHEATAEVIDVDPQILFVLPQATYVAGIRLRYAHSNPAGSPARFVAVWGLGPEMSPNNGGGRYANWNLPTGADRETTIWVDARIDRFQIQPDNQPGTFRFDTLTLLVPERPEDRSGVAPPPREAR